MAFRALRRFWWRVGLPRLPPANLDPVTAQRFEDYTETWLTAPNPHDPHGPHDSHDPPGPAPIVRAPGDTLAYLRWLAEQHEPLFHGSHRGTIEALRPERESHDSTELGNQEAVFASDDPGWAMWFALLVRGPSFHSTRNGAWYVGGRDLKRFYLFSVNKGVTDDNLLSNGWLYVLPRHGFFHERPIGGLFWSSQWVNRGTVRPLARIAVTPEDFPFVDCIDRHDPDDSMLRTFQQASATWHRVAATRAAQSE